MNDLGQILRDGLPNARTRADVVELCKQTLKNLAEQAYGGRIYIRYMQPLHIDNCFGPIDGLTLSQFGCTGEKVAVGVVFIDPSAVDHTDNSLRYIHIGGAVCRAGDSWNSQMGKTIAVLRAITMNADAAANSIITMQNEGRYAVPARELRRRQYGWPWSSVLPNVALPPVAQPAVMAAASHAICQNLNSGDPFRITASSERDIFNWGSSPYANVVADLIDKMCVLPTHVRLTEEEIGIRKAFGRDIHNERQHIAKPIH